MATLAPSYQDYLAMRQGNDQSAFSESNTSNEADLLSEDDWNKLSPDQQWDTYRGADTRDQENLPGINSGTSLYIAPDDPRYSDIAKQAGVSDGRGVYLLHGAPDNMGDASWWKDPGAVKDLGGGIFATPEDNFTQHAYDVANQGDTGFNIVRALSTAAMLYGGAEAAGLVGGGADTGIASTDAAESGGTLSLNSAGTGVTPYVGNAAGASGGLDAAESGGTLGEGPNGAEPYGGGVPDTEGLPGGGDPGAGPQFDPGATGGATSSSGGWVDAVRNTYNGVNSWMNGLSPASRFILGQALSKGAGAVLQGIAQRNAYQHQQDLINQQRADIVRRGQVAPIASGAFTPKSGGIIDGVRTGG